MYIWVLGVGWVLAVLGLAACGGKSDQPETDVTEGDWEVRLESPLDTVVVKEGEDAPGVPTTGAAAAGTAGAATAMDAPEGAIMETPSVTESTPPVAVPDPQDFTPGWRVQLFASTSMVSADQEAELARDRFVESVYVEYEPPYYKVRLGDYLTKDGAKGMANRAKTQGYDEAWVVETLVVRPDQ